MMKRVCAVLFCCAVVQLTVPTRAYAWWDFLEEFSGPGPFWGPDFDARVACLVDTSNTGARVAANKARAMMPIVFWPSANPCDHAI